ncbi:hypothetical protein ABK040_009179 [Willaertia magna]
MIKTFLSKIPTESKTEQYLLDSFSTKTFIDYKKDSKFKILFFNTIRLIATFIYIFYWTLKITFFKVLFPISHYFIYHLVLGKIDDIIPSHLCHCHQSNTSIDHTNHIQHTETHNNNETQQHDIASNDNNNNNNNDNTNNNNNNNNKRIIRALVLGGGGNRGSFETGVLKYLFENNKNQVKYNLVAGNSVGAINAGLLSQYKIGDEENAINKLIDLWLSVTSDQVYKNWRFSILEGLLYRTGLFCTKPLEEFLDKNIDYEKLKNSDRDYLLGVTRLRDYHFESRSKKDIKSQTELIRTIRASSSVPGFFQSVKINKETSDELYVDGGIQYISPLLEVIQKCLHMVGADTFGKSTCEFNSDKEDDDDDCKDDNESNDFEIHVDLILAMHPIRLPKFITDFNLTPIIFFRAFFDVMTGIMLRDIHIANIVYKHATNIKIRLFAPQSLLSDNCYMIFDPKYNHLMLNEGYEAAKKICEEKREETFNEFISRYYSTNH